MAWDQNSAFLWQQSLSLALVNISYVRSVSKISCWSAFWRRDGFWCRTWAEGWSLGCCVPALTRRCGCSWWQHPRFRKAPGVSQCSLKCQVMRAAALQGWDTPGFTGMHWFVPKHTRSLLCHALVYKHHVFNTGSFPLQCAQSFPKNAGAAQDSPKAHSEL